MLKQIRSFTLLVFCLFSVAAFTGCGVEADEGPVEDTVEEIDQAADE